MAEKKTDIWMPLYIGEYMADTMMFTTEQHGAYLLLLMACWKARGVLPTDDESLASITKLPMPRWRASKAKILARFQMADDGSSMSQKRSTKEIERAQKVSGARSKAGKEGAKKRWRTDDKSMANAIANAMANASQNDAQPQSQVTIPSKPPPPGSTAGSVGVDGETPTKAGEVCRAIRARGVVGINPSDPELCALVERGVPVETFDAAAVVCATAKPPKGMAYLLAIVRRQLAEATAIAEGPSMPAAPWDATRTSIEAMGVELGLGAWDENDVSADRESFPAYTERVRRRLAAQGLTA